MDKSSPLNAQCGHTIKGQSDKDNDKVEGNLTAKDGLFIATECHLALLPDEDGDTALHLAVVQGNLEACRKFVDLFGIAGKSIDVGNNLLQTPLHVAIITNNKDIVKLLVKSGSDPDNPDRYGLSAYHLCAKFDHHECFVAILESIRRPSSLNTRDYEGRTALHIAVQNLSEKTFRLLISNKADIDAKDTKGGRTPLIYAIEKNEKGFVEALLERDASVSQQTYSGDTALHIASGRGLQDIVRLLLRRGADATMKNTHFETPMSLAASPMLSDMLRNQYRTSIDTKLHTVDTHSAFITRNLPNQIPSHFLKLHTGIDRDSIPRRSITLKTERPMIESDGTLPMKRPRMMDSSIHQSSLNGPSLTFPRITVKREYFESVPEAQALANTVNEAVNECPDDDIEMKASDSFGEHVEIAMEEVEVSAEEEVATKSDDEDKVGESPPKMSSPDARKPGNEQPYTHKLMQYSTNLINKGIAVNVTKAHDTPTNNKEHHESKPATHPSQPQAASVTEHPKRMSMTYESGRTISPIFSSQIGSEKSKSVPNSPQPAEANLYQLAREGLAVAAMANSVNAPQGVNHDYGLSNYLKARPSRQAKIKSGAEELQNLALQGLAVAAMNAQSDNSTIADGKWKVTDDIDVKPSVLMDFKNLTPPASQRMDMQPPLLLRSNSMPPKPIHDASTSRFVQHTSNAHLSSNRALLALAHANARKEHVGQAVSAISMGKTQMNGAPKFPSSSQTLTDISDVTRQNLRQAIMVKNTLALHSPNVNFTNPASVIELPQTHRNGNAGIMMTERSNNPNTMKFLPTMQQIATSRPAASIKASTSSVHPPRDVEGRKTPEPLAVFNVTIPKTTQYNSSNTPNQPKTATTSHQNPAAAVYASMAMSTAAKTTPTHTVAPLRLAANHNMPMIRPDAGPLYSVVSVATAPVATYQVTPTLSTSKSSPAAKPAPPVSGECISSSATAISQHVSISTTSGISGSSVTGIPVTVALSIQQPPLLNRSTVHVAQPSTQFVQPQIAYIPHGKDLIPVMLPPSAIPPQLQYPHYPTLSMPAAQSSDKPHAIIDATSTSTRLGETYMSALAKQFSTGHPNFPSALPFPIQPTQIRGLYPLSAPLYGSPQQLNMLQHQQFIIDAYLHHQQSLLAQGRLTTTPTAPTSTKPVAAVSAFPVNKIQPESTKVTSIDEQPLNLSIKPEQDVSDGEQPLNLMKTHRAQDVSVRGSVIKSALLEKNEQPKTATVEQSRSVERSSNHYTTNIAAEQAHHNVYLPPPVIINPSAVPTDGTNSVALSALSLPPIHYVNGMPFILGMPPQM